jgi:hypothetical protein
MAKSRKEHASDAWRNPPTPEDPSSYVDRESGEPIHTPVKTGRDEDSQVTRDRDVSITPDTDTDTSSGARETGGGDSVQVNDLGGGAGHQWPGDPLPDDAKGRLDWAQRGRDDNDRRARVRYALAQEQERTGGQRSTVVSGLERLQSADAGHR